jgi:hypothetical protein
MGYDEGSGSAYSRSVVLWRVDRCATYDQLPDVSQRPAARKAKPRGRRLVTVDMDGDAELGDCMLI